jgi:N-acetylglucosamine-6-sulfatase
MAFRGPISRGVARPADPRMGSRVLGAVGAALALLAGITLLIAGPLSQQAGAALGDPLDPPPPNIVLITTDDQPASTVTREAMPNLHERIIDPGSSFSDYIVTTPLCCPSRASMLTGQYGHNNGVLRNDYGDLIGPRNVLPRWLQRVGYTTAHVGKFLNGYGDAAGHKTVGPGWDLWFTQFERKSYYDWKASKNGKTRVYGAEDADHLIEVTNKRAAAWANKLAKKPEPFYMQLDFYAPHGAAGRDRSCIGGPVPAPRDEGAFLNRQVPEPPSYNEPDVSDKPDFIASRPSFDAATEEQIDHRYRCTMASLLSVDRGIGKVVRRIERRGELERTVFIFTSDNGYFFGEHRLDRGKQYPYDENLRMPLAIRVPAAYRDGAPVDAEVEESVANIDLAPTILDLAGAEPCRRDGACRTMDGRSLSPLLNGTGGWPADRGLLIELQDCQYRGVRAGRQVYLEYGSGPLSTSGSCRPEAIEHYDVAADPFQLENLYPAPRRSPEGELQRELQSRIASLGRCAGIADRDPAPDSGAYCE